VRKSRERFLDAFSLTFNALGVSCRFLRLFASELIILLLYHIGQVARYSNLGRQPIVKGTRRSHYFRDGMPDDVVFFGLKRGA